MGATRIRFLDGQRGTLSILELDAEYQPELVPSVSEALFNLRVQVVRCEMRAQGSRIRGRFTIVEFDGAQIAARRRLEIQTAVLAAIDKTWLRWRPLAKAGPSGSWLGEGREPRARELPREA